jgi:CRISPR-associated endonuclease Csn1
MGKCILGLDLGTNSIGWAVVRQADEEMVLLDKGVHIFPKGVGEEKNNEFSLASQRTNYRSARRIKFRRKLRKIETLKVLMRHGYCPSLTEEALHLWKQKKQYPSDPEFRAWLATDDKENKNPYFFRNLAASAKMDLSNRDERFKLGRAFYHLCQRRGYKSNALDQTEESDGKVATGIEELQKRKDGRTLGQYFYSVYSTTRIRHQYTDRIKDYLDEFTTICDLQNLDTVIRTELGKAIFHQRPLKTQKGNIANCPFEPNKKCIQSSHPLYERFRVHQFINTIKIQMPNDDALRSLTEDERTTILPLFYVTQPFKFEKIAKKLSKGKKNFSHIKDRESTAEYRFNYGENHSVGHAPLLARLMNLFDCEKDYDALLTTVHNRYINGCGKTPEECLIEIWHVLATFDDPEKRRSFGAEKLGLSTEKAGTFDKIRLKQGYGNLSLKAIRKILPFLQHGMIYSHSAFMANLPEILRGYGDTEDVQEIYGKVQTVLDEYRQYRKIVDSVNARVQSVKDHGKEGQHGDSESAETRSWLERKLVQEFGEIAWRTFPEGTREKCLILAVSWFHNQTANGRHFMKPVTIKERIANVLEQECGIRRTITEIKLYHPSAIETYPKAKPAPDGNYYLGSPRISSIKNPVFMRTMHRLRALVNELIRQGKIDPGTEIHIEMTRELNDANRRKAIQEWQREREKVRANYQKAIEDFWKSKGKSWTYSDTDILKYQLWEEQNHLCPYTGKTIVLSDFLGDNPTFDIEHTFPRSRTCDNSQVNKTLTCKDFNRRVKRAQIPAELANHDDVLKIVDSFGWQGIIDEKQKIIERNRHTPADPEAKKKAIVKRHVAELERNYYREKLFRFQAECVPDSFANNQLRNTQIICKYAVQYMKSVFGRVHSYKAAALKPFYEAWGVNEKQRNSHIHHCVDAILAACISREEYSHIAEFFHEAELYEFGERPRPEVQQPWEGFSRFMNDELKDEVLVTHYSTDNLLKQARKKVRVRGKIQQTASGKNMIATGQSARGSLHKETVYGAIMDDGELKYVVRKKIADMKDGEMKRIVDPAVRDIVLANKESIKKGEPIWINEEKGIKLEKARIAANVTNPIKLKSHQQPSKHEYNQHSFVVNDTNHALVIYGDLESDNPQKHVASKAVISNLEAAQKRAKDPSSSLFAETDKKGFPLRGLLKIGSKVMFYEYSPEELKELPATELCKRVYCVLGIEGTGRMKLRHHKSTSTELGDSHIDYEKPKERLLLRPKALLLGGIDFSIGITGEIEFLF